MPAGDAGSSPPPPLRPQPTLMMSRPPNQSSSTWWIVLVVVLLALVAVAAAWYFLIRDNGAEPAPQPSPAFDWEGAWGRTDGTGGGVVVEPSGKDYKVTVYGSTLQVLGTATATTKGKDLAFSLESAESVGGLPGPFQIVLEAGPGEDLADMKVTGGNQTTVIVPLKRVAALVPIAPSASPSVTPTPSPSSSPSASPSAGADQQVIDAIVKLQTGVITWATNNNNLYPTSADVTETGGVAALRRPLADERVHGPAHEAGHAARRLHLRTAQRRSRLQAHRLHQQRPYLHGPLTPADGRVRLRAGATWRPP